MQLNAISNHLEKLNAFMVIADVGSLSGATKILNISQSTLSHTLFILEDAIGQKLLERKPRGVELTSKGQVLYDFCKKLHLDVQSLESKLQSSKTQTSTHIRIATHETLAIHAWPELLEKIRKKHPHIHISLFSGRVSEIMEGLRNKSYHLTLTVEPFTQPQLEKLVIFKAVLGLYASLKTETYPQLNKKQLSLKDIKNIPIITDNHAHIREGFPMPKFLAEHGLNSSLTYEVNSFEASLRLASKGLGIAVVPTKNAQEAVKLKRVRKLKVKGISDKNFGPHTICATYRKNDIAVETIALLVDELKEFFR